MTTTLTTSKPQRRPDSTELVDRNGTSATRLLLLTDMPPCLEWTAGIVLEQMCRLLQREHSISCFCATAYVHDAVPAEHLRLPFERRISPSPLLPSWAMRFRAVSRMARATSERTLAPLVEKRYLRQAVQFAKAQGVQAVWAVIEGATMIRMALPLAQALGVPLITQVWDPPDWWFRAHHFDASLKRSLHRRFDEAMRGSAAIVAASWNMAEEYQRRYGVPAVEMPACLDLANSRPASYSLNSGDLLVIGMAGQLYARDEWGCLIAALDACGWQIAGRRVVLRYFGKESMRAEDRSKPIEALGWFPQPEVIEQLSRCDVLFCPYWFDPAFQEETRLSFPSKLPTYLAAGRPVLYLGPPDSSPGRFLHESQSGLLCHELNPAVVQDALLRLSTNAGLYRQLVEAGQAALRRQLSEEAMSQRLQQVFAVGR